MIIVIFAISIVSFVIIQLPPGDYLSTYINNLRKSGLEIQEEKVRALEEEYGLNLPVYSQYLKWFGKIIFRGDFGSSFQYSEKVMKLLGERISLTFVLSLTTLLFTYIVSIPIGIYSATHQYSPVDYTFTFVGFIGLATPNFMLALILMFIFYKYMGMDVGGLFSIEYQLAPWSIGKVWDMVKHLPIPIIVVGTAGTAGLIRVMRATLLDELRKQYVITARAKGVKELKLLFKYPVRVAINPMVSTIGGILPRLVSGATITSIVLSLPTTGPILMKALLAQDMYLAASALFLLSILGTIGMLISDILIVVVAPRIRFERSA
jgi:peptide/nickel transport system permease protein